MYERQASRSSSIYMFRTLSFPEAIICDMEGSPFNTLIMFMHASQPGLLKKRRMYGASMPWRVLTVPLRSANRKSVALVPTLLSAHRRASLSYLARISDDSPSYDASFSA